MTRLYARVYQISRARSGTASLGDRPERLLSRLVIIDPTNELLCAVVHGPVRADLLPKSGSRIHRHAVSQLAERGFLIIHLDAAIQSVTVHRQLLL